MAGVKVSISGNMVRAPGAVREMRREQRAKIQEICERKVAEEQATHAYTNRTGAAQESTAVTGKIDGDRFELKIGMGVKYAVFLDAAGLTNIREKAAEARVEIREYLRETAARVRRGDY